MLLPKCMKILRRHTSDGTVIMMTQANFLYNLPYNIKDKFKIIP